MSELTFSINQEIHTVHPGSELQEKNLLEYLRENGITGVKQVCGEGGCGACTVIVSEWNNEQSKVEHKSSATCLLPLPTLHQKAITTVEGLSKLSPSELHPISEVFYKMGASQCGFCTPGFILGLFGRLQQDRNLKKEELERVFDGNLCRCTGYRPILDAAAVFCTDGRKDEAPSIDRDQYRNLLAECLNLDQVFPNEFKKAPHSQSFNGRDGNWHQPQNLHDLLKVQNEIQARADSPNLSRPSSTKIVAGNTDIGYQEQNHPEHYSERLSLTQIKELHEFKITQDKIEIGAGITIHQLKEKLEAIPQTELANNGVVRALIKQCRFFANNQIRQTATVGGGLVNCSSYSDLIPIWVATRSSVQLFEGGKSITRRLDEYTQEDGSLNFKLTPKQTLQSIIVPLTSAQTQISAYKYAKRRMDSITFLSAGMSIDLDPKSHQISNSIICFDGLQKPGQRFLQLESQINGKTFSTELLPELLCTIEEQIPNYLNPKFPERLHQYQTRLAQGALTRFFSQIAKEQNLPHHQALDELTNQYPQVPHRTHLEFEENNVGVLGSALPHINAKQQTTGQASYSTDIEVPHCLYAHLVTSPIASGKLLSLDPSKALQHPDITHFLSAKDIPGKNLFGFRVEDEEVLASSELRYVGQPIGILIGKNKKAVREMATQVEIEVEESAPILTWEQALQAKSFHGKEEGYLIEQGDTPQALKESFKTVEGKIEVPGQSHFYLEPQSSLVIPQDDRYKVYAATQSPSNVVDHISNLLAIPNNHVEVKVGRIGGGFGGKQLRAGPIAAICALAAQHCKKPVKLTLDRHQDLAYCPGRSPIQAKYKAGFSERGKIKAFDIEFFINGGHSNDYSADVTETAALLMDSCYRIPNVRVHGTCLKMNYGSYTATRGFGKPQASAVVETIMDHAATALSIDPTELRHQNLYQEGDLTITKTKIGDNVMRQCWDRLIEKTNYSKLKSEVEEFNRQHRWLKRGIATICSKGNMGFLQSDDINRGLALVHLMRDGTVSVNHSGCEMGQGINTRMAQVTAHQLQIPLEQVTITDTQSALIPNTPPTTMVATDLIGKAIIDACHRLTERLDRYKGTTLEKVEQAYTDGVSLSETGVYTAPRLAYDYQKQEGDISYFFVWGAALSIAEIDVLSGNFRIIRSEIVQDCGKSLNPHLDIGQAEGGFIFGLGYYTLEEMIYAPNGKLITDNVSSYKIPSCGDVPLHWDVELLNYAPKDESLHSSKGIGEANVQLGLSGYFAIKEAIRNSRTENGLSKSFNLGFPSSVDRVSHALPTISSLL